MSHIVAFDLDGTILDSRARHSIVLRDVLKRHNIDLDVSDLISFKRNGKSNVEYMTKCGLDIDTAKRIQQEWIQNVERPEYLDTDVLYPDSISLLDAFGATNDLILITARNNRDATLAQIKKLNLAQYFKDVYVVSADADAATAKAQVLCDTNAKLMIGDTRVDYMAATIANIPFVFRDNGFHSKETVNDQKKYQI